MHAVGQDAGQLSNGNGHEQASPGAARTGVLALDEVVLPTSIVKRDGREVPFDVSKIESALGRCFVAQGREPYTPLPELALRVVNIMSARRGTPTVEAVQDAVELTLQAAGEFEAAKRYILYRAEHAKQREERPIPPEVRDAFAEADQYFPTPLQKFQYFDKYSRFDYEQGRRETWIETVDRSVGYLHELVQTNTGVDLGAETYERIRRAILEMRAMPSMRLLAMAGAPARRNNVTIYNCSYQPVDSIDSFVEALLISMSGCGVGFSVESQYVDGFPRVKRQRGLDPLLLAVEDSAEGWGEALRTAMQAWFEGHDVRFDFSLIRPSGAPLRTKGGRASGPGPLKAMLEFTRQRILARQGTYLRPIDAHDIMCAVGNAAVSGGVRRTAMISLFDWDDLDLRNCKSGDFERDNSQRWNANNSAVWPEGGLSQMQILEQVMDMVRSERGEPGIFNRQAAIALRPARRAALDAPYGGTPAYGTNPCGEIILRPFEFCVAGDTLLLTREGITTIRAAAGTEIEVWNGKRWSKVTPFKTGEGQPLYRVRFSDGSYLDCTGGHRFSVSDIQTRFRGTGFVEKTTLELMASSHRRWGTEPFTVEHGGGHLVPAQDAYEIGFAVGDGCVDTHTGHVIADLYGPKDTNLPLRGRRYKTYLASGYNVERTRLVFEETVSPERITALKREAAALHEVFTWSRQSILHFIAGWIDADGSETGTGGVRLYLSDYERARRVQLLLTKCGIRSSVNLLHRAGTETNLGVRQHDLWYLQITDCAEIPCRRVDTARGHQPTMKGKFQVITSIEPLDGLHENFCFTEPEEHKGVFGNTLTYQCNLSIAVARQGDTRDSLREKVEVATLVGTIQSLATSFPGLRPVWGDNCREERLLGVDITGQLDSKAAQDPAVQRYLKEVAVETNREYAQRLGINRSASITTVKPSGNSSQLLDCSSGLHARWAKYYERNVRVSASSPVFKVLRDAGVPMDPENGQAPENANTWVIHFPVKAPDGAVTRNARSAIEQCEYWLQNKVNWTEHNPSVTITYRPDEVLDLMKWIWEHRDQLGGMAFLPAFDAQYAQLPYVEISKEEYERRAAAFPEIDFSKLWRYESHDLTSAAQELACVAGLCEIDT